MKQANKGLPIEPGYIVRLGTQQVSGDGADQSEMRDGTAMASPSAFSQQMM
jgi:hypothetical protein